MGRLTISGFQTPGFIKDVGEYVSVPEAFNEVRNIRFNSRGAVTVAGHEAVMSPAPFSPIWLKMFPPLELPNWVYASATRVGVFQAEHQDITRLSGAYSTPTNERWSGDAFNGVGIFNNTYDVPQQWLDFSGDTPLENLANWPSTLRCKFIRPFKEFLIAGNLTSSGIRRPQRLRWSHPADPGTVPASWDITDPAVDAGEIDIAESNDALLDGYALGDQFIVYKQKSAHSMQLGGPDIFTRRELYATKGVLTRDCVQSVPIGHFVVGVDDIYLHAGQRGSEQSLIDNRLRNWVFNQISKDNYFYCYTVPWRRMNEIWFCFPEAGETYPTLALIYNTVTHGLGVKDIPRVPFMYPGPVIRATASPAWGDGEVPPPPPEAPVGPFTIEVGEYPDFTTPNTQGYNAASPYGDILATAGIYTLRAAYYREDIGTLVVEIVTTGVDQDLFTSVTFSNGVGTFNSIDASSFASTGVYAQWVWEGLTLDAALWPTGESRDVTFV